MADIIDIKDAKKKVAEEKLKEQIETIEKLKEEFAEHWEAALKANKAKEEKLKKERERSNKAVIRSYRLGGKLK